GRSKVHRLIISSCHFLGQLLVECKTQSFLFHLQVPSLALQLIDELADRYFLRFELGEGRVDSQSRTVHHRLNVFIFLVVCLRFTLNELFWAEVLLPSHPLQRFS
ncbi:hypothetical protein PMAYCL1PPCAC_24109, partial [Pristionchus mayeri]